MEIVWLVLLYFVFAWATGRMLNVLLERLFGDGTSNRAKSVAVFKITQTKSEAKRKPPNQTPGKTYSDKALKTRRRYSA